MGIAMGIAKVGYGVLRVAGQKGGSGTGEEGSGEIRNRGGEIRV